MVSLKYETDGGSNDCISGITGEDLCAAIKTMKYLADSAFIGATFLFAFRRKFLK